MGEAGTQPNHREDPLPPALGAGAAGGGMEAAALERAPASIFGAPLYDPWVYEPTFKSCLLNLSQYSSQTKQI